MTKDEFYNSILTAGYPVAYLQFSQRQKAPFIVYGLPENNDVYADNSRYFKVMAGWLELYSSGKPDFAGQDTIERIFETDNIPYSKENEAFLESEGLFYCRWSFELIGG